MWKKRQKKQTSALFVTCRNRDRQKPDHARQNHEAHGKTPAAAGLSKFGPVDRGSGGLPLGMDQRQAFLDQAILPRRRASQAFYKTMSGCAYLNILRQISWPLIPMSYLAWKFGAKHMLTFARRAAENSNRLFTNTSRLFLAARQPGVDLGEIDSSAPKFRRIVFVKIGVGEQQRLEPGFCRGAPPFFMAAYTAFY
jgi:hypothetical protein